MPEIISLQMAVKSTKNKQKAKSKSSSAKNKQQVLKTELKEMSGIDSRSDYIRFIVGMLLIIVSLFLLLAIISNIFTGGMDQAGVMAGDLPHPKNYAGRLGAYAAHYIMEQLFGVFSILLPILTLALALKIFMRKACPIRMWLFYLHTVIIMVVGSLDANFIQDNFLPSSIKDTMSFELGGMHGKVVLGFLTDNIGTIASGAILVLLTISYIGYWFTQVFIAIFKGIHKIGNWILPQPREDEEDDATDFETDYEEGTEEFVNEGEDSVLSDDSFVDNEDKGVSIDLPPLESEGVDGVATGDEGLSTVIDLGTDVATTTDDEISSETIVAPSTTAEMSESANDVTTPNDSEGPEIELSVKETLEEETSHALTAAEVQNLPPIDPRAELSRYKFPPLSILEKHDAGNVDIDMDEQHANKNRIIQVLGTFGVKINQISATVGPTVTLYEITPAPGVRISKIKNLEEDIALSLAAIGIRIIAPMPGKGTIGIEVPNKKAQIVSMESILKSKKFQESDYALPIALGKTITNEIFMVDLAKMPHLLVAGATGQGKSVGLNAIISSLLYKKHPAELKLVMIDPKKVEFSMYNPIVKHFLAQVPDSEEPVITDVKKVVQTLMSLTKEMDDRYELLKAARCKNLKEYNEKFLSRRLNPNNGHHFLPYIVVIIDEFGDLIMTAGKDIELPIARIAQLARAVGIHMVIATQSPRATIITGKIKANFPARMAFRVSGRIESQTILDRTGANNLIGRGDMLFLAGSDITRLQCAFIDTPEIEALTDFISQQQGYPYPYELPLVEETADGGGDTYGGGGEGSTFEQVARFVVSTQQGSTSKIQRTFSIGFNRAGRLMDQLEEAGIVGPVNGSKPREVYVQSEIELQQILDQLKAAGKRFD